MSDTTLHYGGTTLTLTKSDHLVALRPRSGTEPAQLRGLYPREAAAPSALGGFQVIDVESDPLPADEVLDVLRAAPGVSVGTHVYHTSDDDVPFVPTGRIYVKWEPDASPEAVQGLLEGLALEVVEPKGAHAAIVRVTPDSPNPVKAAAALQDEAIVTVAEPDLATPGALTGFSIPTDPYLDHQWHLRNTGMHGGSAIGLRAGADARVVAAWERARTLGSRDVVVAVIDDGFDLGHPDLSGVGKVVAPWDFTRNTAVPSPDPLKRDWHGSACAGVAVGNAQGSGIVGAAPGCRMMPIRWGPYLTGEALASWFDYVREQGAWVVSCSWGAAAKVFVLPTLAAEAISNCARHGRGGRGCVICFAAGNDGRDVDSKPTGSLNGFAIHPDVIAVSACTSRDERSNYSNFGRRIWICAPSSGSGGRGITTADVRGHYTMGGTTQYAGYAPGDFTHDFGGTSSSCPLVAGVCALVLSIRPELTAVQVRDLIRRTARRIGPASAYDKDGHSPYFGFGCIDADAAVAVLMKSPEPAAAETAASTETPGALAVA